MGVVNMAQRVGLYTVALQNPVGIDGFAAIVGPKEGEGPLATAFDQVLQDDLWGENSWELAESRMFGEAARLAASKTHTTIDDVQVLLGGDLLDQLFSASFAARGLAIPFLGLYGACSTMAESIAIGALLLDGGGFINALCTASSHFSSAERQYRLPLEMGTQRPPTAQRTVTGAGSVLLNATGNLRITHVTMGRVVDYQVNDVNNMGAAMAPAALDTLVRHFQDTDRSPAHYDAIITGDLAQMGTDILLAMAKDEGYDLTGRHMDCGNMIYSPDQKVDCGGSGCGCSASVMCGYVLPRMREGKLKRVFFMATGALMSLSSSQQGETIPGIAHGIAIEYLST